MVLDPEHLHRLQVDDRVEAPDRVGVVVVVRCSADPEQGVQASRRPRSSSRAKSPIDQASTWTSSDRSIPALRERGPEVRVGLHGGDARLELVERDRRGWTPGTARHERTAAAGQRDTASCV